MRTPRELSSVRKWGAISFPKCRLLLLSPAHLSLMRSPPFPDVGVTSHLPPVVCVLPNYWVSLFTNVCLCVVVGLSLSRRSGRSVYLPQICAPLPPSDSVWSLSFAKVLPTPIECLTLRLPSPHGGLGSSCPPPPLDPAEQALCARRQPIRGEGVGARRAGRDYGRWPCRGKRGSPRTCSLPTWILTPFLL